MKTQTYLLLFFILSGFAGAAASMPLGTLIERAHLEQNGLSFDHARGTIWKGEIIGLQSPSGPIGSVALSARPLELFSGELAYGFRWQGDGGQGQGVVRPAADGYVQVSQARFNFTPRDVPVVLRVSEFTAVLNASGCRSASGAAQNEGAVEGLPAGSVSCDQGRLHIDIEGLPGPVRAEINQLVGAAFQAASATDPGE